MLRARPGPLAQRNPGLGRSDLGGDARVVLLGLGVEGLLAVVLGGEGLGIRLATLGECRPTVEEDGAEGVALLRAIAVAVEAGAVARVEGDGDRAGELVEVSQEMTSIGRKG
jgi:hypothetical protein